MYYIGIGCEVGQLYRGATECGKQISNNQCAFRYMHNINIIEQKKQHTWKDEISNSHILSIFYIFPAASIGGNCIL